ncbi:MAG: hypothetical protein JNJ57_13125 [Saprospiraceae bacterium]|nr:hypothetical protein [Saprospiraceae bacterium]
MAKQADIIIAGAGLAGLCLATGMAARPFFQGKKILILDRDKKVKNDRTWCYWAVAGEKLPPVQCHTWNNAKFYGEAQFETNFELTPYQYHMVRGLDYYNWAKQNLTDHPNIEWLETEMLSIDSKTGTVHTTHGDFQAEFVFNSALKNEPAPTSGYTQLLQHFKGWVIETPEDQFDADQITFMDYRLPQHGETRFVYVLPLSKHSALVEFTVFSKSLLNDTDYDDALRQYVASNLNIHTYRIKETEFGVIPMTDFPFPGKPGNVFHIGTAGGFVKGSSGYAYKRTHRKIEAFLDAWVKNRLPDKQLMRSSWRFRFYDSVMLRVLNDSKVAGDRFFTLLFKLLPAPLVLKFLDEDTTFVQELKLLSAPPTWPFLQTAFKQFSLFFRL